MVALSLRSRNDHNILRKKGERKMVQSVSIPIFATYAKLPNGLSLCEAIILQRVLEAFSYRRSRSTSTKKYSHEKRIYIVRLTHSVEPRDATCTK